MIGSDKQEGKQKRLKIEQKAFYILRSKEKIALPPTVAVYCRAMDETIGEMRIHYAGFVHPFFGLDRKDGEEGTPLIFEVRGHNVDVSLVDGERMAKLIFYRMSENAEEKKKTKKAKKKANEINSTELALEQQGEAQQELVKQEPEIEQEEEYTNQTLLLSKLFQKWPKKVKTHRYKDGSIEAEKA